MLDVILGAEWEGLARFLSRGNPPLWLQFAGLNCLFAIVWAIRRVRDARLLRERTSYAVQIFAFLCNALLLLQHDIATLLGQAARL